MKKGTVFAAVFAVAAGFIITPRSAGAVVTQPQTASAALMPGGDFLSCLFSSTPTSVCWERYIGS